MGYREKNCVAEEIIEHMKTPATFLNITIFSGFRIGGHPYMLVSAQAFKIAATGVFLAFQIRGMSFCIFTCYLKRGVKS